MDCFYAAIEIRDCPALANKPVAVGGLSTSRGVICTANYAARKFGVRAAMSSALAMRQCKNLIILPVDMPKYRQVAERIKAIFLEFSDLVEPLSLDEAYIDVTDAPHCQGSATLMARAIRQRILETEHLVASAGVAPNKFLAKIASGWQKPDGFFVIRPQDVEAFIQNLAVEELYGVGKVTASKLQKLGIKTCSDLQKYSLPWLLDQFGKLGQHLFQQCRGIDNRRVEPNRQRKSLSVERTFAQDISDNDQCLALVPGLYQELQRRISLYAAQRPIKNQFIKIKYDNFKQVSAELASHQMSLTVFQDLFQRALVKEPRSVRLLGMGVHFFG